jgi:hypothetical protein
MYLCGLIKRVEKEIKAAQQRQKTVLAPEPDLSNPSKRRLFCGVLPR